MEIAEEKSINIPMKEEDQSEGKLEPYQRTDA